MDFSETSNTISNCKKTFDYHKKIPELTTHRQHFDFFYFLSSFISFLRRHTFQLIIGAAELLIQQASALQVIVASLVIPLEATQGCFIRYSSKHQKQNTQKHKSNKQHGRQATAHLPTFA